MGSQGETRTRNPSVNSRTLCRLSYLGLKLPKNLANKVIVTEAGCWEWTGAISNKGYAQVGIAGKTASAHRVVYRLMVGPIPEGMQLDHLCRVRHCLNPAHLEAVTQSVNQRRGFAARGPKPACKRGHDTTSPDSRNASGMCRECDRERHRAAYWRNKQSEVTG